MSTYMEDLAAVRPTQMTVVPRLANMMYDHLTTQLEQGPAGDELAQAAHKQARPACKHRVLRSSCMCSCAVWRLGDQLAQVAC